MGRLRNRVHRTLETLRDQFTKEDFDSESDVLRILLTV